jgi:hypothetical protein
MWNIAKLLIPLFFLAGCPLVSFEYLDIFCSVHEGDQYYSGQTVDLVFSIMPDRQKTERILILNEGGLGNTPVFSWSGKILHVRPLAGWKKGEYYSISLDGSLAMEDGRTYTAGISRAFIYGMAGSEFCLTGSSMEDRCLVLHFSKAPKITSFNKQFILSPSTEYLCDFFGETVRIQPKNSWQINTLYTWSFTGMESLDGYTMKKEYSGFFSGDEDLQIPYPVKICPVILPEDPGDYLWKHETGLDGNLENNEAIGFIFSKPMDHASLRSGISFSPAIKGYFETVGEDAIIFIPEEEYKPETEYRITFSTSIKDSLGLGLFEEIRLYFSSARPYLQVEKVNLDSNTEALESGGTVQDHFLEPPSGGSSGIAVKISFSQAIPQANQKAAADAVSLSVLFPASAHNPALVSAQWLDNGAVLSLHYDDLSPSGGGVDNYYQLKILSGKQGPVNGAGDYLKEDLWYVFRTF